MTLQEKTNRIRRTVWVILILLAFLLETTQGLSIRVGHARLYLVLPMVICIAMFEKEKAAPWFGLFAGLLLDIISPNMIGYHALVFLIICTFVGVIITHFMRNNLLSAILFCTGFLFLYQLLYWLFFVLLKGHEGAMEALTTVYLPTALFSMIGIVPIYLILRGINKAFRVRG